MKIGSTHFLLAVLIAAMGLSSCERVDEGVGTLSQERISLAEYENYKDFGDYVLHVNALGTNQLPPEVAQSAGIVRSDNRGMLNVVILKKLEAQEDQPWAGAVKVAAANLAGQYRSIDMRKVTEQDAIYYITAESYNAAKNSPHLEVFKKKGDPKTCPVTKNVTGCPALLGAAESRLLAIDNCSCVILLTGVLP